MAQNIFGDLIPSAPTAPSADPIIAPADPYRQASEARARSGEARANAGEARANDAAARAAAADARAAEADRIRKLEWDATHNPDGTPKISGKALSDGTAKRIETGVGQFSSLAGSLGGFRDEYAGNTLTGEVENWLQGLNSGIGTEGQRNWWANFRATDNVIRNELFGAALTPQEKSAYEATTISPSLDPKIVRENLQKRTQILKTALDRQQRFMIANGYNPEAVNILYEPLRAMEQLNAAAEDQPSQVSGAVRGDQGGSYDPENGLTVTVTDDSPMPPPPPSGGGSFWDAQLQGLGSIVEGAASLPAIVVDPLATTLGRALGYDNYTSDFASSVRSDLGLPKNEDSTASAIIRGGTSALTGAGIARGAASLATSRPVLDTLIKLGATPLRDAASGAAAGFGGEVGREIGGVPGQIVGSIAGGIGGYGGASAVARGASRSRVPNQLLQAADDLGVTMLPADVGGAGTRMASGAVGRTIGGVPLAEGAENAVASAGRARDRLASEIGDVADQAGAGQAARRGFNEFEKGSAARADQLYQQVSVPGDSQVQLSNTRQALGEVTRGMQSNPDLSRLWANHPRLRATLEALTPKDVASDGRQAFIEASDRLSAAQDAYQVARSNVTSAAEQNAARQAVDRARADVQAAQELAATPPQGGQLSWDDMKRFRSIVGEIVGQPGVSADGSDVAGLRKLYAALTSDMEVSAAQAGPKALQEFRRANQFWRGRQSRIDDVFAGLFGNRGQKSDEAVFRQLNSWAQNRTGDFSRLARTIRSLPADEADTVRASIVQRMGQAKPGRQDATGEVFSPAEFSTQWNSLDARAKSVLFPNKDHRANLEKFAQVAASMKRATEYQNFSNTALVGNLTAAGTLAGTAAANGSVGGVLAVGATNGAFYGLGKLLASPRVARILASSTKMPIETGTRKISDQLGVVAAREPLIANDIQSVQQYLADFGRNLPPPRAAASDRNEERRSRPIQ